MSINNKGGAVFSFWLLCGMTISVSPLRISLLLFLVYCFCSLASIWTFTSESARPDRGLGMLNVEVVAFEVYLHVVLFLWVLEGHFVGKAWRREVRLSVHFAVFVRSWTSGVIVCRAITLISFPARHFPQNRGSESKRWDIFAACKDVI